MRKIMKDAYIKGSNDNYKAINGSKARINKPYV